MPSLFLYNQNFLWADKPEAKCYNKKFAATPALVNYEGEERIETIGADPFCGSWHKNLRKPIQYDLQPTEPKKEKTLCPIKVINLDSSVTRWNKLSQTLNQACS